MWLLFPTWSPPLSLSSSSLSSHRKKHAYMPPEVPLVCLLAYVCVFVCVCEILVYCISTFFFPLLSFCPTEWAIWEFVAFHLSAWTTVLKRDGPMYIPWLDAESYGCRFFDHRDLFLIEIWPRAMCVTSSSWCCQVLLIKTAWVWIFKICLLCV